MKTYKNNIIANNAAILMTLAAKDESGNTSLPFPPNELHWEEGKIEIIKKKWGGLFRERNIYTTVSLYKDNILLRRWTSNSPNLECFFEEDKIIPLTPADHSYLRGKFVGDYNNVFEDGYFGMYDTYV